LDRHDLRPRPARLLTALLVLLVALGAQLLEPRVACAQRADKMLRLLKKKPRGMTTETWLEQRREAARELGRLKDRRAVPVLLKIIGKERFDVILEIAIDALGEIGDKRAVEPLRRLLNDPSLDSYVRDAVAGALKKLGADEGIEPVMPPVKPPVKPPPVKPPVKPLPDDKDLATRLAQELNPFGELPPVEARVPADLLGKTDRWQIIGGSADVRWDSAAGQTVTRLDLGTRYFRQVERKSYGYTVDGALDLGFRYDDTSRTDASWDLSHGLTVNPEIRFYPFRHDLPKLFGQVSGGAGYGVGLADHPMFLDRRFTFAGHVSVGGGPGYGRILDMGPRLRLRRLEFVLKKAGILNGSIDRAVGDQIIHTWYHERNRIGSFTHLGYTLDILRRANLLAKEHVDPATTYRLVRILDDPQLDDRPAGIMLRLGYGYARSFVKDVDDTTMAFLYLTGEYIRQKIRSSLEGRLRFFYEMYNDPDHYGVSAEGGYNAFLYSSTYDPLGALGATVSLGLSNQPGAVFDDGGLAFQALVGGSYTRFFNRGSAVVASLRGGLQNRAPLILFTLEARYGIAPGSFVSSE
jgi:hypothetical protein